MNSTEQYMEEQNCVTLVQKTEGINDATFSGSEENKQTTLKVKTTRCTNRYKIRHETKYKHIINIDIVNENGESSHHSLVVL